MSDSPASVIVDQNGNIVGVLNDAGVYRLQVEAAIKPGSSIGTTIVPDNLSNLVRGYCLNGASSDLRVDGDPTPQVFTFLADATYDIALSDITLVFQATQIQFSRLKFGRISPLTNGVKIEIRSSGTTTEIGNIKHNAHFYEWASGRNVTLHDDGDESLLSATFQIGGAVTLVGGSGDFVRVTIRDDLDRSTLNYFACQVRGYKVVV